LIEARNDDLKLFPGMTAKVRIETARRERVLRVPAAALRFKPRGVRDKEQTADKASRQDRQLRQIEKMKQLLALTDDQVKSVTAELTASSRKHAVEADGAGDGNTTDPDVEVRMAGNSHARSADRMELALLTVMTAEQQRVFEAWKKKRQVTRPAAVWVLDAGGDPEMRSVRLGLTDSRYAEVASGSLKVGDQVIVATRKARSK
jgi:multidrug efflux pump subunit AcrA (membrane-fusion protein)